MLKQPNVLMLLYLLPSFPLKALPNLSARQILQTNWDYYTPRTDHTYGSSIGPAIHAILACQLDKRAEAYEHFVRALLVDLKDVRGNTKQGIHAASNRGVWLATATAVVASAFALLDRATNHSPSGQESLASGRESGAG